MLSRAFTRTLADRLLEAERSRTAIPPLTDEYPGISEPDAYRIQQALLNEKEGECVGYKLGFTSAAMREQMGVAGPNFGRLTSGMRVDSGKIELSGLIHPRVEPEIALLTESELSGPGLNAADARRAVSHLCAAIEVVDSRYEDYRFRAADNTADNSSAARFVLGEPVSSVRVPDPGEVEAVLWRNGRPVDRGRGTNAMEDPLAALAWLANRLGETGRSIEERSIVLTGGLTSAHLVEGGDVVKADLGELGVVDVHFLE